MPPKKVSFTPKASSALPPVTSLDDWVSTPRSESESITPVPVVQEKLKRLTIDIPVSLHTALKTESAKLQVPMADLLREILMEKYGNKEIQK